MYNKLKKSAVYFIVLTLMSIITFASISAYNGYPSYFDPSICFLGACAFWVIIWFIIWIAVAIWVYKDAERRGKSGALWLIIVIILGLIGIIIWLIVRPPIVVRPQQPTPGTGRMCPDCGRPIPFDANICPYCGKKF